MSEENVDVVRRAYESFDANGINEFLGLLDPDIEWNEPEVEGLPFGGQHRGIFTVANNVLQQQMQNYNGFHVMVEKFLDADADDTVVVLGNYIGTGKVTDKSLQAPFAHICVVRDGKIVNLRDYTNTASFLETHQ